MTSVAATRPGTPPHSKPLPVPAIAETEISADDVEPDESSSHTWLRAVTRRAACPVDEPAFSRFGDRRADCDSTAVDLVRLCRLLL